MLLFFLIFLVVQTFSALTSANDNRGCDSPGKLTWSFNQDSIFTYDALSYYYDSSTGPNSGDSVRLVVKRESTASNFQFTTYDNKYSTPTTIPASSTADTASATYTFVGLVGPFLVLKKTNLGSTVTIEHMAYKFQTQVAEIQGYVLPLPSGVTSPTNWVPFHYDSETGSLLIGMQRDSSSSVLVEYQWDTYTSVYLASLFGSTITSVFSTWKGNRQLIYDSVGSKLTKWSGTQWTQSTPTIDVTNKLVQHYPFRAYGVTVLSVMESTKRTGKLYVMTIFQYPTEITCPTTCAASSFDFLDYSDNVQNFVRVSSENVFWVTLKSDGSTIIKSIVTTSDISASGLQSVALTNNKAIFLYDTKISYYSHEGDNDIRFMFTTEFTTTDMALTGTDKQIKVAISCTCGAINKMACFSATLQCVIFMKAGLLC